MTVSTTVNRIEYTASLGQTIFQYPFIAFAESNLSVYVNSNLKTLTTDYTISGINSPAGGEITFNAGLLNNDKVIIIRTLPLTQGIDYVENDPFPADSHEKALDKSILIHQQFKEELHRTLKVPITDSETSNLTLPGKAERSGKVLAFNTTTGDPEGGPTIADTNTVAGISADISTVAGIDADVTTVANNIGHVTVVSTLDTEIQSVYGMYTEIFRLGQSNVVTDLGRLGQASVVADIETLADIEDGTVATNAIKTVAELQDGTVATNAIKTVADNSADIQTVASNATTIINNTTDFLNRYLGALSGIPSAATIGSLYFNTNSNTLQVSDGSTWNPMSLTPTQLTNVGTISNNIADVQTLADIEDGTVFDNALSNLASLAGTIDGVFEYAVFAELLALVYGHPSLDSDLKTFLTATHSDGNPVGDLDGSGSITPFDVQDAGLVASGSASSADIAAFATRVRTPALSNSTLYDRYFNTSYVIPPLLKVYLNSDEIQQAATLISSGNLHIPVFSQYSGLTTGNGNGLVPAPTAADIAANRVLRADGTWVDP